MKLAKAFLSLFALSAAQEVMYGCQVSVNSQIVSAQTTLNYLLQFNANVQTGDYLNITLPQKPDAFDSTGCNFVTGRAFCAIQSPLSVSGCQINTQFSAQITYKLSGSTAVNSLQGNIQYFNNPDSAEPIENIQFALVGSNGVIKSVCQNAQISFFQPTTLAATLTSSSSIVGATGATLSVQVTPSYILAATGSVTITVPEYYANAGTDYMISGSVSCTAQSGITVQSCSFQQSSKTVTIIYSFNNNVVSKQPATFYLNNCFKNPITPETKYGFFVATFDKNQYAIGLSSNLSLAGITTPNTFNYVTFQETKAIVGQLDSLQVNIGMMAPLPTQCFVKFVFPQEFTINSSLYQATGNSFFVQLGQQNGIIPFYSLNLATRTVVVQACQVYSGQNKVGSITFQSVGNPLYITDTSSFQVFVSKDAAFTQVIASQTTGLIIQASSFLPGVIQGKVTATQTVVSAAGPYSFTITAPTSINGNAKLVITMPTLVTISKQCTVIKLTASTTCQVSGQAITLLNPFQNYIGGTQLTFQVGDITNPISVRDIGTIQIQSFIQVGTQFYLVDQVLLTNQITPVAGIVTALQQTQISSYVTYDSNTLYIFSMNFQHTLPVGSTIRVALPPGMKVQGVTQFQTNCFRLDKTQVPQKLTCTVNNLWTGFDVTITSSVFGASGLPGLETFKLQVINIQNARTLNSYNLFKFQALDSLGYLIDISTQDPLFAVTMTQLSQIQMISVGIANATNGAVTDYTMTITPNTPLFNQDSLAMTFPKEVSLPSQISCSGTINTIVSIQCTSYGNNQVLVQFMLAGSGISAAQTFSIVFKGIKNAVSTRPTSSWTNFLLSDVSQNGIATYNGNVQVSNKVISNIKTYSLGQDTKEPNVQAQYSITFSTNNPIPYTGSILVLMPSEVPLVRDGYSCYVLTNTRQNMMCSFQGNNVIKIPNAFNNQPSSYTGTVVVNFVAQNPSSNVNTNITLQLTIYDNTDFAYPVDQILSGLNPTFVCNYPCLTCSAINPNSCVTCPTGINKPIYLQVLKNGTSTCQTACNPGFTYNSLSASKVCIPCDPSCATCRVGGGGSTDQEYCLTCTDQFPVYWRAMNKCYTKEQGCPNGSWLSNVNTCKSCTAPCLDCISATLCNYCDPFSAQPLLQNSVCVSSCMYGFTPLYTGPSQKGICAPCQSPCATCQPGLPNKCLTCAQGEQQFLFGSQCVSECPKGTVTDLKTKKCDGCPEGCNVCSIADNSICLVCEPGLSMLSNECFTNCPPEYIKSVDGSTCELRQYPLDKYYAPFPFMAILALFYAIILASWILTRRETLLCQNMIAATALVLIVAEVFQFLRAVLEGVALTIVQTVLILIANIILNVVYQISFKLQVDDYKFNLYVKYHGHANRAVQVLCVLVSLHLHRLVYSKLFPLPIFHAATTAPDSFYRPLLLYSQIQIASIAAPIFFSNIYYAASTGSTYVLSNQLQCTNIELMLISIMLICLVLYERFFQHPRFLNFRADHDAINTFQTVFGSNKPDELFGGQGQSLKELKEIQGHLNQKDRLERHKLLKQVVGAVRANKDTLLNLRLDYVLDEEITAIQDKQDSMPDLKLKSLLSEQSADLGNYSWEGVLPGWSDDAAERLKLLAWMEEQLQQAAEKERQMFDLQQQRLRFKDKECMYDNQMFDNVFFSQKTLRVNEFDHHDQTSLDDGARAQHHNPSKDQKGIQTDKIKSKSKEVQVQTQGKSAPQVEQQAKPAKAVQRQSVKAPALPIPVLENMESSSSSLSVDNAYSQRDTYRLGRSEHRSQIRQDSFQTPNEPQKEQKQQEDRRGQHDDDLRDVNLVHSAEVIQQQDQSLDNSLTKLLIQESIFDNTLDLRPIESENIKSSVNEKSKSTQKQKRSSFLGSNQRSAKGSVKGSVLGSVKGSTKSKRLAQAQDQQKESISHGNTSFQQSFVTERDRNDDLNSQRSHDSNLSAKPHTLDYLVPGPETKMWQERVTLFKTLLLDCRPVKPKINENQNDSVTDPTQNAQDPNAITQINIVEDLADSVEQYDESSSESIDDDWFKKQPPNDWQYDNININMRNFNIFSVQGNFPLDNQGRIINRQKVLQERDFKDLDGYAVNEKGYLINETTGAIYSKFTFEDLFMPVTASVKDYGELPMPYRLERFNFNPHSILGNFDFDQLTRKPIFLKNKFGQLTDKNFRPVNKFGYLINSEEDIISDDGEIKLKHCMLLENGDLPPLLNYQGREYNIKDIIGQLRKDSDSKQLEVKIDKNTQKAIDEQLRPVNAKGYLVNDNGSIINQEGQIIFNFWELLCQEPPKFFKFTQWSIDWIKGRIDPNKQLQFAPGKDNLFDLDQKMINIEGYLIDKGENVIDHYGRTVFKTDLLMESSGQDAKIPPLFTMGILSPPQEDIPVAKDALSSTIIDNTTMNKSDANITQQNGRRSLFNLNDTAQSAQQQAIQAIEMQSKKKKPKKLRRQQSTASEGRYGKKILNQYQQYLENPSQRPFSSLVAGMSSVKDIRPILGQRPPLGSDYFHKEEISNKRNQFASSTAMVKTPNSVMGRRVHVNQYMNDVSPIPKPIPDLSYAAKAESFFNQTRFLSQQDDLDMFNQLSGLSHKRNDSRAAISQQFDDIHEIYSSKKRPQ